MDSKDLKILKTRPYAGVCYDKFFYATVSGVPDEVSQMAESWLKKTEDFVASKIEDVIDNITQYRQLTHNDRYILAVLLSMLWIRGPRMRRQINQLQEDMMKWVMKMTTESSVDQYLNETGAEWIEDVKRNVLRFYKEGKYTIEFGNDQHLMFTVEHMGLNSPGFANMFYGQHWRIFISGCSKRFVTSDNPVVEWCPPVRGFWGKGFIECTHVLALTPKILLELTPPVHVGKTNKIRRKTIYDDENFIITKFNFLIADSGK